MLKKFLLLAIVAVFATLLASPAQADQTSAQLSRLSIAPIIQPKEVVEAAPYILQLQDAPLALYRGGVDGIAAIHPQLTGRPYDGGSADSLAYLAYLEATQSSILAGISQTLGRDIQPLFQYKHAFNGIAIHITPAEAERIARLPGISKIFRETVENITTDAGPTWIGADKVWVGGAEATGLTAELSGANEVPPNNSTASGWTWFRYNVSTNTLAYQLNVAGITQGTAAHIHTGNAGANGPVLVEIWDGVAPLPVNGELVLTNDQEQDLMNGGLYINVHSAAFPGGEIRGQIQDLGTQGEGTAVAVLDTGINFDHPSFADIGGDGYDHPAPPQYFGVCDPADDQFNPSYTCNDKLMGGYSFVSEAVTPEDSDGHGSHTASTVAGNFVDATLYAPTTSVEATISGVAPHAQIIAMDVCVSSCPSSSILAAINKVVELNGLYPGLVDALNFSISGGENPYNDPTELAFLTASTVGVVVSTSAGNSGPTPFTVAHRSPWLATVAATTHNRSFVNTLSNLVSDGDSLPDMAGVSLTAGYGPANIVYAGDYGDNLCFLGSFLPDTWNGEIVICDRGTNARVDKGLAVLSGGAGGMILADNGSGVVSDPHFLPATHISQADGTTVKDWANANANPQGVINGTVLDFSDNNGDIMGGFSSRGPNDTFDVIKPSIAAPGIDIWAAIEDGSVLPDETAEYNLLGGTSMASPHHTGASLLVKAVNPDWTPQQILSALMMSSVADGVLEEDRTTPADPYDQGSGRVQVHKAIISGLLLDESEADFLAAEGDDSLIRELNIPSLANSNCTGGVCLWTRTVQSSVAFDVIWEASSTGEFPVQVTPTNFVLPAGATQELTITADASALVDDNWHFAAVALTPSLPASVNGGSIFCSTPNLAIPDNNPIGVADTLTVESAGTITDLNLTIETTHTWVGDLVYTLEHAASGTMVTAIDQPGMPASTFGCSQNHINATLDDEASAPVEDACASSTNPTPPPYAIDGSFTPNNGLSAFDGLNMPGDWTLHVSDMAAGDLGTLTEWCVVVTSEGSSPSALPIARMPVAVLPTGGSVPELIEIVAEGIAGSITQSGFVSGYPVTDLQLSPFGLVEGSYFTEELSTDPTNGNPYDNLNDGTTFYEVFNVPAGTHRLVAEIIFSESPDIDLFVGMGSLPSAATMVCFSASGIALEYCNIDNPTPGNWWVLVQDWEDSGNPPDTVILSAAVVADSDAGNLLPLGPTSVPAGEPFEVEIGWNEPSFATGDRWYGAMAVGTDAGNPANVGISNINIMVDISDTPIIHIMPNSLEATLPINNSTIESFEISNMGAGVLNWQIFEQAPPAAPLGGITTLTHSASQAVEQLNSVSCNAGGLHTDNAYLRRFNLNEFGISGNFTVSAVQIGVEAATGASGTQPITVNLYTLNGSFVYANMTLIGTTTVNIPDQELTVYEIPVSGLVPAGSELVVELFTPDGQPAGNSFFIGSNNDGQTDASYLAAADCLVYEPTDIAAIGFPDMHIVMNVLGTAGTCDVMGDIGWAMVDPSSGDTAAGETDTINVTFNSVGLEAGVYMGTLCVTSNDAGNPLVPLPLSLTVTEPMMVMELDYQYTLNNGGGGVGQFTLYDDRTFMDEEGNGGYWGENPDTERIAFSYLSARCNAFLTGQLQPDSSYFGVLVCRDGSELRGLWMASAAAGNSIESR